MTAQEKIQRGYTARLRPAADMPGRYEVIYLPRAGQQERAAGTAERRAPEYRATATVRGEDIAVRWDQAPADPDVGAEQFDADVRRRVRPLHAWLERLAPLVADVRAWAEHLGWSVRQVEKPLRDAEIGDYRAPGLVLQQDMLRVGLEPIGRSTPGTQGVVDLYLLPAYDDIASLYFYDGRWNLQYRAPEAAGAAEARPLSREALRDVLGEMMKNVG